MPKSIAKSCPLCLSVNDPVDMLPVTMEHSTPPQTAPLYLCRLCVIQIMKSTLQSDVVDPREVFGDVEPGIDSDRHGGRDPAGAEAAPALVPEGESGPGAPAVDRPEPEVSAGGEDGERAPEKG